jgi:hypothetical protein
MRLEYAHAFCRVNDCPFNEESCVPEFEGEENRDAKDIPSPLAVIRRAHAHAKTHQITLYKRYNEARIIGPGLD